MEQVWASENFLKMIERCLTNFGIASNVGLFFLIVTMESNTVASPRPDNPYYSRTDATKLNLSDADWKKVLSPDVYAIARGKGTEQAFTGKYNDFDGVGSYYCAACGNALFRSDAKFASSCGWPSFFQPLRKDGVLYRPDTSYGMNRTEVLCGRCDAHLGHLFDDGPPPTGKRFCMNSIVLDFEPDGESEKSSE